MTRRYITLMAMIAAFAGTIRHVAAQPAAQGSTPASAETAKRADVFFKQGVRLYSDKKWAEAEAAFLSAWALNPTFDVAYNLGSAEYQLGKYRGAAEHLAFALHHWPLIDATSSLRKTAEQRFEESRAMVATLTVKVNVPRAEVFVDGKSVGRSPLEADIFVEPGAHTIEVKLDGYNDAKEAVQAAKGASQTVTLTLVASVPMPSTTATSSAAPAASSTPSAPPPKRSPVPAIAVGGVAVGAAAVGVGFFVASNSKRDEVFTLDKTIVQQDHQHCVGPGPIDKHCPEIINAARDRDTFNRVAIGAVVGAGVLAAGALAYLLWPAPKPTKVRVDVHAAPTVGTGYGGLIIGGSF